MMITMIVIVLALSAVGLFYMQVRNRRRMAHQAIRPVDLKALHTLLDRDDELFLRERLPRRRFCRLKRQRIGVTLRYVNRIANNAAAVVRLSETARLSSDLEVAETAAQIIDLATQIRLQCLLAFAKLSVEFALPSLQLTPAVLAPRYQALRDNLKRLGALQTQQLTPSAEAI
jgi:hypothetical protein